MNPHHDRRRESTRGRAPAGFALIAIGPALVEDGIALNQLWVFWLVPLIGGALSG